MILENFRFGSKAVISKILALEYTILLLFFSEVHDQALQLCDTIHRERRILLKQEIGRMVLFFTDQPSLLAPNIQVSWMFQLLLLVT